MNAITRTILEHIINKMLRKQNEWTDLFIQEINDNYHKALNFSDSKVFLCGWYYFVTKNGKTTFHIAKCAK